ncbi:MAG: hypothetical protein ACE5GW_13990, partial [Planctomycetota bacterium]
MAPQVIHRLQDGELRIRSGVSFPLEELRELELRRPGDSAAGLRFPVGDGGLVSIPEGSIPVDSEGAYELAIDGEPLVSLPPAGAGGALEAGLEGTQTGEQGVVITIEIVGPWIDDIIPNPVTVGPGGQIAVDVVGEHILPGMWLGLIPEQEETVAHRLRPAGDRSTYEGMTLPGEHRLAWGRGDETVEQISGQTLTVHPAPEISDVSPRKVDPGRVARLTFRGTNLASLEEIVDRCGPLP